MSTTAATPEGPGSVSGAPNLAALTKFLAPYRDGAAAGRVPVAANR